MEQTRREMEKRRREALKTGQEKMSNSLQNVVPAIGADYNSVSTAWIVMKSLQVVRWSLRHKWTINLQRSQCSCYILRLHTVTA